MFQVLFTLQNSPWPQERLADLEINQVPLDNQTAKYDLSLCVRETDDGLQTEVEYNVDLFNTATIERMMGHFARLLRSIADDPDQSIASLPLLGEEERRQLLVDFNDTAKDYPSVACLHQLVEAQAARSPAAIAVDFEGDQLTYSELNRRANQLAALSGALGVQPDRPVGVCLERSPEMVIGLLAILKAGGAYVPLDPDYPADRLSFMIADSRRRRFLRRGPWRSDAGGRSPFDLCRRGRCRAGGGRRCKPPIANTHGRCGLRDLHLGLDGRPKGVLNPHAASATACCGCRRRTA